MAEWRTENWGQDQAPQGDASQDPYSGGQQTEGDSSAGSAILTVRSVDFASWAKAGSVDKVAKIIRGMPASERLQEEHDLFRYEKPGVVDARLTSTFSNFTEVDLTLPSGKQGKAKRKWVGLTNPYAWATKKIFPGHTVDSLDQQMSAVMNGEATAECNLKAYAKAMDATVIQSARDVVSYLISGGALRQGPESETVAAAAALVIVTFTDGTTVNTEMRKYPGLIKPNAEWSEDIVSEHLSTLWKLRTGTNPMKGEDRLAWEKLVNTQLYYARLILGHGKTMKEIMDETDPLKTKQLSSGSLIKISALDNWAKKLVDQRG